MMINPVVALVHNIGDEVLPFWPFLVFTVAKMVLVFSVYMVGVAYLTLSERKISAWIQGRLGPNRVGGKLGLMQPWADGVKNIMKEETLPAHVNKPMFMLAPMLAFIPAMLAWAVIPFGAPLQTRWGIVELVVADIPVGFLFVLAITSLGVYGIVLAGWASNNKYALLGGLRSSAQMVSYEIAMGMSLIPVLLLSGNVTLSQIVNQQASMHLWNVLTLSVSFFVFLVAAFAETNRLPFDLPEAESELIAGYHTEYSAMKFSMFPISEYANMATSSALMATLFFEHAPALLADLADSRAWAASGVDVPDAHHRVAVHEYRLDRGAAAAGLRVQPAGVERGAQRFRREVGEQRVNVRVPGRPQHGAESARVGEPHA